MKNILNTVALCFFLFLGIIGAQAQGLTVSDQRPENIAKEKVSILHEQLDLSGDQQRALFRAYVKREVGIKKHVAGKDTTNPEVKQQKTILNNDLEKAVEIELSKEQFLQWKKEFAEK